MTKEDFDNRIEGLTAVIREYRRQGKDVTEYELRLSFLIEKRREFTHEDNRTKDKMPNLGKSYYTAEQRKCWWLRPL